MTLETKTAVVAKLVEHGLAATLEYPGFIQIVQPDGTVWNFGDVNPLYGCDVASQAGGEQHYETTIPSESEDVEAITQATFRLVRPGEPTDQEFAAFAAATFAEHTINPQAENFCTICNEIKPIHRRLTLTDSEGNVIDSGEYCKECWSKPDDGRASVREVVAELLLCGDELE